MTKYLLRRDMYAGDILYRRDDAGTEIPDEIQGRKVVLYDNWDKKSEKVFPLPRDATLYDEKNKELPKDFHGAKAQAEGTKLGDDEDKGPDTLSGLSKATKEPVKPVAETDKNPNITR